MDIISYNIGATANGRIESFIENPDSTSGVLTVPKTIATGETITIPSGRVAVLPNVQVDGTLNIEGDVFIPAGATFGDLESQIASKVSLNEDEVIAGVKTFSSSPIVPTPTSGTQAVNKDYTDLKVALTQFTGANQNLTNNGYQKLPGGLIIQWGKTGLIPVNSSSPVGFPIVFPNSVFSICLTDSTTAGDLSNSAMSVNNSSISTTGMTVINAGDNQPGYAFYLVIGY